MTDQPAVPFVPAPTRRTIAGWTPARQATFIAALVEGHSVGVAAAAVGLSPSSAYALRRTAGAAGFAEAWDIARQMGAANLDETALHRALHGVRRTVFYRGQAVGERVDHDHGLLLALLKRHDSRGRRKSVRL